MKFTIEQQKLSKSLNIISKAVTARTTMPILKGILLDVDENGMLKMAASDLDITIENTVQVSDPVPGAIVVQAKLFGDIIRKLPNADILIEEVDGNIVIKCKNTVFNLICMDADEFPSVATIKESSDYISIDRDILKDMIRKTQFAASPDMTKGTISGILTEINLDNIKMVTVDGFRLAVCKYDMVSKEPKKVIISARLMGEISKIISETESENDVKLILDDNRAIFIIDNTQIIVRLIDGEFLRYNDIIPKDSRIFIRINKNYLSDSIERASLVSKDGKNHPIKMDIRDNIITITSKSEEGNVQEDILVEKTGDNLEIGFNAKYLLDVLKVIDDEEIIMKLNTATTSALIEPVEGDMYQYLVLPVRLSGN